MKFQLVALLFYFSVGGIKAKSFGGNSDLRNVIKLFEGELKGPEGFAVDRDGMFITTLLFVIFI